jgi:hypothetical protein
LSDRTPKYTPLTDDSWPKPFLIIRVSVSRLTQTEFIAFDLSSIGYRGLLLDHMGNHKWPSVDAALGLPNFGSLVNLRIPQDHVKSRDTVDRKSPIMSNLLNRGRWSASLSIMDLLRCDLVDMGALRPFECLVKIYNAAHVICHNEWPNWDESREFILLR